MDKIKSEIVEIHVDEATYKGTGTVICPTYINYFFGNNGTGKSTIAKVIKEGSGLVFAPGKTASDYCFHIFDQDFINNNMHSYHNLPGVFTMNAVNKEIQDKIDGLTAKRTESGKRRSEAATGEDKKKKAKDALLKQLYQDCWDKTSDLRKEFDKTQEGKKKSRQFTEEVQSHQPEEQNLDELRRLYDSAYSSTARRYPLFSSIENTDVLDTLPGSDILGFAIVNSANTPFADFLKAVGSTEWVRKGHKEYHSTSNGKCPYCSQDLPDNFEEMLRTSFDDQYQTNLARLDVFLTAYREAANALFAPISKIPDDLYPAIDVKPYREKIEALKNAIALNIERIKEKKLDPAKSVELEPVAHLLQELSTIIEGYNKLINDNNAIVAAGPRKQSECKNAVFSHMAFVLKDVLEAYGRSNLSLQTEIDVFHSKVETEDAILLQIETELRTLSTQTVETETAMNNINIMLKDSGFQGFEVRPATEEITKPDGTTEVITPMPPINYAVVRTGTGKVAENLSEGEKNFIAFLYFQQLVFGSEGSDGSARDKIVVIDDPVSSMDSSALFIVGAQIRKMVEICRNNADNRNAVVAGNFIKQLFILTHNAFFHREVTYPHANRYEFVSFYLVKKAANRSSVKLFEEVNPECPTEKINVNPVKNSYAALWEEYKEVTSGIPLMNTIRRILEYYFLQLCGYDGSLLRQRILEEHKNDFAADAQGREDYTKYDLASAMLSYIASNETGFNDGMHYVDDYMDTQLCRDIFKMIFKIMGQEQHYNMMMGIQ